MRSFTTATPRETFALGERLGKIAPAGLIIALHGDLGAGKTALTQGIAAGMGVNERVTSPTFTLINRYEGAQAITLIHIDCYRLGEDESSATLEATNLGLEEILAEEAAVVVIEWAELVTQLLPPDHLSITLHATGETTRRLTLVAGGEISAQVLNVIA